MTDYVAEVQAVLDKRNEAFEQLKAVEADNSLTAADKAERSARLNTEIDELGQEAERYVRAAEREVEHRKINAFAARLTGAAGGKGRNGSSSSGAEWRSVVPDEKEWRALVETGTPSAGGYAVPTKVASEWIDKLRAQSTFLRAPGLNVVRFEGGKFVIPQLTASTDPAVVGEGNAIPEGSLTFAGPTLDPVKYAALYRASQEMIDDASIDVEDLVAGTLIRDIANVVDRDSFQGAGTTTALSGLTAAGNSTAVNLGSGKTVVTWDDVIDAYGAIAALGGTPTVVWASVDMWKGLVKARENGTNGAYLAGSVTNDPARAAMGLPLLPSANLPIRTVIVADATRVFTGIRKDVRLARSEQWKFDSDSIGYRATFRVAGLVVAEATSVQRIVAAAS